jgi:hypothetical protein
MSDHGCWDQRSSTIGLRAAEQRHAADGARAAVDAEHWAANPQVVGCSAMNTALLAACVWLAACTSTSTRDNAMQFNETDPAFCGQASRASASSLARTSGRTGGPRGISPGRSPCQAYDGAITA